MAIFSKNKSENKPVAEPGVPVKSSETAFIGSKLAITGKLSGSGNLVMMGRFEGEFDMAGEIVIAPSAEVKAEVKAATVTVSGHFNGNLHATDKIQLERTAVVGGRLMSKRLTIVDGAVFNGEIEMKKEESAKLEAGSSKGKKEEKKLPT